MYWHWFRSSGPLEAVPKSVMIQVPLAGWKKEKWFPQSHELRAHQLPQCEGGAPWHNMTCSRKSLQVRERFCSIFILENDKSRHGSGDQRAHAAAAHWPWKAGDRPALLLYQADTWSPQFRATEAREPRQGPSRPNSHRIPEAILHQIVTYSEDSEYDRFPLAFCDFFPWYS